MNEIIYFLKFGKRHHLTELADGKIYFGNAKLYREIEEDQKLKGQGDKLEASTKVFSDNIKMIDNDTNKLFADINGINIQAVFRYPDADPIPIFCLFAVYAKDCRIDENGISQIHLSDETKEVIRRDFPKADSVGIIKNPELFIDDIRKTIACDVKYDTVHYFRIDKGYTHDKSGQTAIDHDYAMYLTQDTPPVIVESGKKYSFNSKYLFRVLFCKDEFFNDQQEYRIVLPNERIERGKIYHVNLSEKIEIVSIEKFFEEH